MTQKTKYDNAGILELDKYIGTCYHRYKKPL